MCSCAPHLQGCPVSDRMQVPTAAELPLKRNKTLLIYVGGLVGLCVSCFPASPVPLCPAFLFPFINEWSGSVSPCSLQKVLFAPLSTALLLILWYSLLPIFCKAKQSVSVGFPPFLQTTCSGSFSSGNQSVGQNSVEKTPPRQGEYSQLKSRLLLIIQTTISGFFLARTSRTCSTCALSAVYF